MIYSCRSYAVDLGKIVFVSQVYNHSSVGNIYQNYRIYLTGLVSVEPFTDSSNEYPIQEERDALVMAWKEYNGVYDENPINPFKELK